MATYARDLLAEFGPELDEQGAVFRRQYHLDPYLAAIGEGEIRDRLSAIGDNLVEYRFVWPLFGTERIPLDVELGSLKDISELLVIDATPK
jgi:hypothetical protein